MVTGGFRRRDAMEQALTSGAADLIGLGRPMRVDTDAPAPRSVAIIHCVGSRDQNHNPYCSLACYMYSLKFAHLVKEKLPDATCYQFYIDMRAFGKGFEELYDKSREAGVRYIRGIPGEVEEDPETGNLRMTVENTTTQEIEEHEFVSIVGRSGTGKTTLLNLIGCLDRPSSGSLALAGTELEKARLCANAGLACGAKCLDMNTTIG